MTTSFFPITGAIGSDAEVIINALNTRSEQIKSNTDSQGLLKKVSLIALQTIGLSSGIVTLACIPVAAFMFSVAPLTIGAIALGSAISSLGIYLLMDPRNTGELIIRDYWKNLFEALREGNGKKIIETCQELAKQKESRASSFNQCLGALPPEDLNPFFHKTCLTGYLQIAVECLRNGQEDQAKSNAHLALSHFDASGFSSKIEEFVRAITLFPKKMSQLMQTHNTGTDLHALDYLLSLEERLNLEV